jgi:putative SOS response-associated peptidase YedK
MCGRFTLTWDGWRQVVDALGVQDAGDEFVNYRPRFNIAPTDQHFIVTSEFERRKAQHARWGLVNRSARDNSRASQCINAKAETLDQRPTFAKPFFGAAVSCRPTGSTNGPARRANVSRYGSTRAPAA